MRGARRRTGAPGRRAGPGRPRCSTPSRSTSRASRSSSLAAVAAGVGASRARAGSRVARAVGARRVLEDEPVPIEHHRARGRAAAARRASLEDPLLRGAGAADAPGARDARACASTRASPAAGASCSPARAWSCATRSAWRVDRAPRQGARTPRCSCCRGSSRSRDPAGRRRRRASPARARAPAHRRRGRPRRPAPAAPGHARVADLLAVARARRGADGAPAARRVRHAAAGRARPARRRGRGGPRRRRARRGVADRASRPRRRLRAAAARRAPPGDPRADAGRLAARCTRAWRSSTGTMRPSLGGAGRAPRAGPLRGRAAHAPQRRARWPTRPAAGASSSSRASWPGARPSFSVAGCHGYELSGARAGARERVVA